MACTISTTGMTEQEMGGHGDDHAMEMAEMPEMVAGELTVQNVRANLSLPSTAGSVWMLIMNGTETDDAFVGAEIAGCGVIELHDMIMENDIMIMQEVEGGEIPIPAGEVVELKQGGLHVMCIDKEAPLELGTTVDIALQFANAGTINVTGEVVAPGEMAMDHGNMGHGEGEGHEARDHDAEGEEHDDMAHDEGEGHDEMEEGDTIMITVE